MSPLAGATTPDLVVEHGLLGAGARLVAGMDEVGRGSLAGPVSVGVVVVDAATPDCPEGVADSKLLTPAARTALLPVLHGWGLARAVGHASAAEIDAVGIVGALRLAGRRALTEVSALVGAVDAVVLDGSHDWLSPTLLDLDDDLVTPRVHLQVKADLACASVAAASVLAKCTRDALMVGLAADHPDYGWDRNKGYASAEHVAALRRLGPSPWHRVSWRLPGCGADGDGAGDVAAALVVRA